MFAVIKTGGKQYRVQAGDVLQVEKLPVEAGEGVQFDDVLMLGGEGDVTIGAPMIDGAAVTAAVLAQGRGPKLYTLKRSRRTHSSRRLKGHRQYLTTIRVLDIIASGATRGAKPVLALDAADVDADLDETVAKASASE